MRIELEVHSSIDPPSVTYDTDSSVNQPMSPELNAHVTGLVDWLRDRSLHQALPEPL